MNYDVLVMRLTDRLLDAERKSDQSLAAAAELLREMAESRAAAGLAIQVGHTSILSCAAAIKNQVDARSRLAQLHERLASTAGSLGVTAIGPETKPDDLRKTGRLEAA